jgi:hypothetical protein
MHAEYSNSGALALLLSLNVKFVNTFQKNTEYFSTNYKFLGILATNSRLSSNNREDIKSTSLKRRYTMFNKVAFYAGCSILSSFSAIISQITLSEL